MTDEEFFEMASKIMNEPGSIKTEVISSSQFELRLERELRKLDVEEVLND